MWTSGSIRRATAAAPLSWQVRGCYSWQAQGVAPRQLLATGREQIRAAVGSQRFEVTTQVRWSITSSGDDRSQLRS